MEDICVFVLLLIVLNVAVSFCDAGNSSYVIYPGSDTANITCYGRDVINITRTELRNVPSKCNDTVCNLSEDDKQYIYNTCDGNSFCEVTLKRMSPCITMTGFINVNYTCQRDIITCDFESGRCVFGKGAWRRVRRSSYGPSKDHTSGSRNGYYFYVYTGANKQSLISSTIRGNTKQCISFYHWINYLNDSMVLYRYSLNKPSAAPDSWKIRTLLGVHYLWEKMTISMEDVGDYWLVIEASGKFSYSRFAIDDITITNTDCEAVKECDFEQNTCGWNGNEEWTRRKGSTLTSNTWPKRDYSTTSGEGYYVYLDTSNMINWSSANFTSPSFTKRGDLCFVFWYYMNGYHIRNLNVYYESENGHSLHLRAISGDQKQVWLSAHIDISTTENFNIILEGQRGGSSRSYIAIDDMSLLPGKCTGDMQHQKVCTSVEETISLDWCHYEYQSLEHMHIYFDPTTVDCREYLEEEADTICMKSDYYTYCNAQSIVEQNPSCFALNSFAIYYTCEETSKVQPVTEKDRDKDSESMVVGVIGVVILIVSLTFSVLFIIYRRRRQPNKHRSTAMNDFTVSWDSDDRTNAMNSPSIKTANSDNRSLNKAVHSDMQHNRAIINPSYSQEYVHTSSAVLINASDLDLDNEYMNMPSQQKNNSNIDNFGYKCTVLDRKRPEYTRPTQEVYELAFTVTQTVDDDYAESVSGQYDISGNTRHRLKDTIYDHSIDDMYDTSYGGRHLSTGDDTYDHTFGRQTEDKYDIAQ